MLQKTSALNPSISTKHIFLKTEKEYSYAVIYILLQTSYISL